MNHTTIFVIQNSSWSWALPQNLAATLYLKFYSMIAQSSHCFAHTVTSYIRHFNFSIIKPDNNIPIIGDNDSGYLFHSLDDKIHSYRNFLASIFYNLTHHDNISKSYLIDNFIFIYSLDEINEFFLKRKKYNTCSKSFKNGGYYIMRNNKDFLITSINKNINMGTGGHHHNDSMSFELHSDLVSRLNLCLCDKSIYIQETS